MLLLMDRAFDDGPFLAQVAAQKAQFLVRLSSLRKPLVLGHLPDGSLPDCHRRRQGPGHHRPRHRDLPRRHQLRRRLPAGHHPAGPPRLPGAGPDGPLPRALGHEVTYLALRHTLLKGRVLRSGDPAGVEQEMWALLALYQALRTAVTDAVQSVPGLDPDRASWQRRRDRPGPGHHRLEHHRPRRRPARRNRPRRPREPARPPPPPRLRPHRQEPAQPLERPPRPQAPHQRASPPSPPTSTPGTTNPPKTSSPSSTSSARPQNAANPLTTSSTLNFPASTKSP